MGWIKDELDNRKLPDLLCGADTPEAFMARREEIKRLLAEESYGVFPPVPESMRFEVTAESRRFCRGHALLREVTAHCTLPGGKEFSFPFSCVIPVSETPVPAFVSINFTPNVPDQYMPSEEIADNGFAVFSFCADDISTNDLAGDFANGIGPFLFPDGYRGPYGASKLTMWAWGAMRIMDYVMTLDCIDRKNVAVIGHSRMGKTALIAGGFDERFSFVISNDSGCAGAALNRGKTGEPVSIADEVLWFWHCENHLKYNGDAFAMPFDQHFLLALTAPRNLYIGSASLDDWADPKGEYLGGMAASPAWEIFGLKGLVGEDRHPEVGEIFHDGSVGFHLREGEHYLSRWDWLRYMEYIRLHYKT